MDTTNWLSWLSMLLTCLAAAAGAIAVAYPKMRNLMKLTAVLFLAAAAVSFVQLYQDQEDRPGWRELAIEFGVCSASIAAIGLSVILIRRRRGREAAILEVPISPLTPRQIRDRLRGVEFTLKQKLTESYAGNHVRWHLKVTDSNPTGKGQCRVGGVVTEGSKFDFVTADLENTPSIKILKQGDVVTVDGWISEISELNIHLSPASILTP